MELGTTWTSSGELGHEQSDEQRIHSSHHAWHCKTIGLSTFIYCELTDDRSATQSLKVVALHRVLKRVRYVSRACSYRCPNTSTADLFPRWSRSVSDWHLWNTSRRHVLRSNHSQRALATQIRCVQSLFPSRDWRWSTQSGLVSRTSVLQSWNVRVWSSWRQSSPARRTVEHSNWDLGRTRTPLPVSEWVSH